MCNTSLSLSMIPAISISTTITMSTNIPATPSLQVQRPNTFKSTLKFLSKSGKLDEALHLIESQPPKSNPTEPLLDAYLDLLHACISRKSLQHGQRLYLQLLLSRTHQTLLKNPKLKSKFITLYSICGQIDEAFQVFKDGFEHGKVPESVWVAMIIGFLKNGQFKEGLLLYCDMLSRGVQPGNFSFSAALKGCAALNELLVGRGIHGQIVKSNKEPDQVVYNALLMFYEEGGCFEQVVKVFDEMPQRNVVSWNLLISGLIRREQLIEGLKVFKKMQGERIWFSWVTLTIMLPLCARLTAIYSGKEIHAQIVKSTARPDVLVLNSLIDMYAKCGAMSYCRRVFNGMDKKDLTTWNTIIQGYAINGFMMEAMDLFNEMVYSGYCPDEVTFISLLSGCSHTGLTNEGRALFEKMRVEFGVTPTLEHYACLVDILGRAGEMKEALEVVENMPMKPSASIWGSLLNSCSLHGNVSLAEVVVEKLFDLEPNNPGNYVMLSNIYAKAGMWSDVKRVRDRMEKKAIKKEPGCSWMQIKDRIHTFLAGGDFKFRNSDEYKKLRNELMEAMEKIGYIPDTTVVLHDVNKDMKTEWVCGHSERLATMFGLIHTGSGSPIRVTKNLRVCADCHTWMKFVSKVTRRVIVLRDTNRFHHFDSGMCSCKDFW